MPSVNISPALGLARRFMARAVRCHTRAIYRRVKGISRELSHPSSHSARRHHRGELNSQWPRMRRLMTTVSDWLPLSRDPQQSTYQAILSWTHTASRRRLLRVRACPQSFSKTQSGVSIKSRCSFWCVISSTHTVHSESIASSTRSCKRKHQRSTWLHPITKKARRGLACQLFDPATWMASSRAPWALSASAVTCSESGVQFRRRENEGVKRYRLKVPLLLSKQPEEAAI